MRANANIHGGKTKAGDWLRVSDVATLLGVSANTVRRWTNDGVVRCQRSPGGHRRYRRADVLALLVTKPASQERRESAHAGSPGAVERLRALADAGADLDLLLMHNPQETPRVVARKLCDLTAVPCCDLYVRANAGLNGAVRLRHGQCDHAWEGTAPDADLWPAPLLASAEIPPAQTWSLSDDSLTPEARQSLEARHCSSMLSLPLATGGRLVGLAALYDAAPRDFAAELEIAADLSRLAAHHLDAARLLVQLNRRAIVGREMAELGGLLYDPQRLMKTVTHRVVGVTGALRCAIYRQEAEGLRCLAAAGRTHAQLGRVGDLLDLEDSSAANKAVATKELIVVSGPDDPRLSHRERQELAGNGLASRLVMPLCVGDHLIGLIDMVDDRARDYAEHLDFIVGVAQIVAGSLENAQLLTEVEQRNTALRELVELGEIVSQTGDLDAFVRAVAERLYASVGAADCDIWRYQGDQLRLLASYDRNGFDESLAGKVLDLEPYPSLVAAIDNNEPLVIANLADQRVSSEEVSDYGEFGFQSVISIPLSVEGRVVGLVELYDTRPRDFAEHYDFLLSVTQLIAGSFENATLLGEVEARNATLRELVELGQVVSQASESDEYLRTVAERLLTVVDVVDCDIWRLDGKAMRLVVSLDKNGRDESEIGLTLDLEKYPAVAAAIENGEPLVIKDFDDPRLTDKEKEDYKPYGFQSIFSVPLSVEGRSVGLVELYDTKPRDWAEQRDFLVSVSQLIAGSFEKVMLLAELRHRADMRRQVLEIGELVSQAAGLDELVRVAAERMRELFGVENCDIWRVEDDRVRCLVSIDSKGYDETETGRVARLDEYPGAAQALAANEPFVFTDLRDPRLLKTEREHYQHWGLHSGVNLPLVVGDRAVGVIDLFDDKERDYSDQLDTMRSVGQLVAGAFAKTVLLDVLERRVQARHELLELGEIVSQTLDLDRLAHSVARRLLAFVGAACCDIYRLDGDQLHLLVSELGDALRDTDAETQHVFDLPPNTVLRETLVTGEPLVIASLDDPRLLPEEVTAHEAWGTRSALWVPLLVEGRAVGFIDIEDVRERDYAEHLDFARNVGQLLAGAFAKTMLLDELQQRVRAQQELVELGRIASQARDLEELQQKVAQRLFAFMDAASCDVYRVEGDRLRCVASTALEGYKDVVGQVIDLYENPSLNEALATGEPLVIASLEDPRLSPAAVAEYVEWGSKSSLTVPLVAEGKLVGIIDIDDLHERDFAEHLDFARNVGHLLTGAFEKASLLDRLEAGNSELRAMVDAGLEFGATLEVGDVLRAVATRILAASEADMCDIYRLDGDQIELLVTLGGGGDENPESERYQVSDFGSFVKAADQRQPVLNLDVLADPETTDKEREDAEKWGYRSLFTVPLVSHADVIGFVVLLNRSVRAFDHEEVIIGLTQMAAQAIVNASLYRQVDDTARRMSLISESGMEFSASLDLRATLTATANRLRAAADVADCDILLTRGTGEFHCLLSLVGENVCPDWQDSVARMQDWPLSKVCIEERRPTMFSSLDDPRLTDRVRQQYAKCNETAGLILPLIAKDEVIGTVELLETRGERVFSDDEIATAEAVCRVAALAIDNAQMFANLQATNQETALVNVIAHETTASLDMAEIAAAAVTALQTVVPFELASLMLIEDDALSTIYSSHPDSRLAGVSTATLQRKFVARLMRENVAILDLPDESPFGGDHPALAGLRSAAVVALTSESKLVGVLNLASTVPGAFNEVDRSLLERVATPLALSLHNARLYENIKSMHLSNLKALSSALNAKDYYTLGHAARVSAYMVLMGEELGWPEERIREAEEAAYLHDIGKIGISDRVLLKPGKLNAEEWELMRQHPVFSADIIQSLFSEDLVLGVRHHHERYDGRGYPDGLAGEAIPKMARAMCVVDSYDAMSFQRTYRSALNYEECLAELSDCRGKQFDPDMVDVFLRVLTEMEERRAIAVAAAEDAAMRIDPAKHILLTTPEDAQRPEYEELCLQLREVRDAHPPVRFLTTHARVGNRYVVIGDGEEESTGEKSLLGEEIFTDDDLHSVLAGERLNMNTLVADEFGVWINALAMVRDANGKAIAIADADLPPFATAGMGGLRSGSRQALAAMLQTAARRGSHTEIDAITDGLTGLYNHRYLHERLAEQIERAGDEHASLSLLFCNLDHFKQFNDERGHSNGDKALRAVAHVLEQAVRRVDLAARFGGEEFVLVLMDTALDGALEVAERIRSDVHQAGVALGDDDFTISIGVAAFPDDAKLKEEFLDKAEWAMQLAKRRGRDQVVPFAGADAGQYASAAELDHASHS